MSRTLRYLFTMLWGAVPALALFFCLRPVRTRRLQGKGLYSCTGPLLDVLRGRGHHRPHPQVGHLRV